MDKKRTQTGRGWSITVNLGRENIARMILKMLPVAGGNMGCGNELMIYDITIFIYNR
jgi:hypothetical protein